MNGPASNSLPLPQWLNFLIMAAAILLVTFGALVWSVSFRRKRKRKRKHHRHKHGERRQLNPTLAQTGGLPPIREEEKSPARDEPSPPQP
jgi:hypothetical protein